MSSHRIHSSREVKARQREMWALGDYHKVASAMFSPFGHELVAACGIGSGQRVLDVAAGSGNVAIKAAEVGAQVVACDITPKLLDAGRREATARDVEVEWVEADAEALPFSGAEFDVVTSSIGAMFAPNHQTVADELLRVCRPGGMIGMINWTPDNDDFGRVLAPCMRRKPPGIPAPALWGNEEHVRQLFDTRVQVLTMTRKALLVDHFTEPVELRDFYKANFGPVVAAYNNIANQPDRLAALDRDLGEYAATSNLARPNTPALYSFEYLLVIATKPPTAP